MYLAHLSHSYSAKNKLELAFYNYLKGVDRITVENEKVNELKADILKKYDSICKEFSRCKPIEKSFHKCYDNKEDFNLTGANVIFKLLKSK